MASNAIIFLIVFKVQLIIFSKKYSKYQTNQFFSGHSKLTKMLNILFLKNNFFPFRQKRIFYVMKIKLRIC